jgi:hypothetical protein
MNPRRWIGAIVAGVLALSLATSAPILAVDKDTPSAPPRPSVEHSAYETTTTESHQDARHRDVESPSKRKSDLGKMLLLWFLRNHPLQD